MIGSIAIGAALVLAASSVLLVSAAGDRFDESRDGHASDAVTMVDLRLSVETAYLGEVAFRLLDLVDPDTADGWDRPNAQTLDTTTTRLQRIGERGGPIGTQAQQVLELIHDDPRSVDTEQLFDDASGVRDVGMPGRLSEDRIVAIDELGLAVVVPLLVLIESSAAELDARGAPASGDDFIAWLRETSQTDGGWLGAAGARPLRDSVWLDFSMASSLLTEELAEIESIVDTSPVADLDARVAAGPAASRSSTEFRSDVDAARALQFRVAALVDALIQAETDAVDARVSSDRAVALLLRLLGAASGLAALALLVLGVGGIVRVTAVDHATADLAFRDPLTGLGNRHELERGTRARLTDERFHHHVVAMVDLDRFKMVNDLHGHAAGDHVLREIAGRLRRFARAAASSIVGAEHSVVRLGGDEFLVTLHSPTRLDIDRFRDQLDLARDLDIPLGDDVASGGFSIGVVEADGPADLDGLLAAADLAMYEDKSRRAHRRITLPVGAGTPA